MQRLPTSKTKNGLRIVANLPIDPGGAVADPAGTPPPSPRTPVPRVDAIGYVFGNPISNLEHGRKPTKREIIQLWMHLHDTVRLKVI